MQINSNILKVSISITFLVIFCCCGSNLSDKKKAQSKFSVTENYISQSNSIQSIDASNDADIMTIHVPENAMQNKIDFTPLFDSIYYVKLQTCDKSIIGQIDKLLFCKDVIIVVERIKRQKIFLFNCEGRFLREVGKIGKGPGEYLTIRDVAVDYLKNNIVILDDRGKKLITYDLNGNVISEKKIKFFMQKIAYLNDGSMLIKQIRGLNKHLPKVMDYALLFADTMMHLNGKSMPLFYRDKFPKITIDGLGFLPSRNGVLYHPLFNDTIFEIRNRLQVKAKYILDLGSKNVVNKFDDNTSNDDELALDNTFEYYSFFGEILETENYACFEVSPLRYCYFSKVNSKLYCGSSITYKNSNIISFYKPIAIKGNYFVQAINPSSIINKKIIVNTFAYDVRSMISEAMAQDNPILFFYSLK